MSRTEPKRWDAKVVREGRMTRSQYTAAHNWIRKMKGTPSKCEHCGTEEKHWYHWANLSQEYKREVSDWARLCIPCHQKHDNAYVLAKGILLASRTHCENGHEYRPENFRWRTSKKNTRLCLLCERANTTKWRHAKRALRGATQ